MIGQADQPLACQHVAVSVTSPRERIISARMTG
jgi:hypothetical protein